MEGNEKKGNSGKIRIFAVILVAVVLFATVLVFNQKKSQKFEQAKAMYVQNEYAKAGDAFEEVGRYRGAKQWAIVCRSLVESDYQTARETLEKLGCPKDQIQADMEKAIEISGDYEKAMELFERGEYDKARAVFRNILSSGCNYQDVYTWELVSGDFGNCQYASARRYLKEHLGYSESQAEECIQKAVYHNAVPYSEDVGVNTTVYFKVKRITPMYPIRTGQYYKKTEDGELVYNTPECGSIICLCERIDIPDEIYVHISQDKYKELFDESFDVELGILYNSVEGQECVNTDQYVYGVLVRGDSVAANVEDTIGKSTVVEFLFCDEMPPQ